MIPAAEHGHFFLQQNSLPENVSISLLHIQLPLLTVNIKGKHKDDALDDILPIAADVHQRQRIGEHADDEHAHEAAPQLALTAGKRDAASTQAVMVSNA